MTESKVRRLVRQLVDTGEYQLERKELEEVAAEMLSEDEGLSTEKILGKVKRARKRHPPWRVIITYDDGRPVSREVVEYPEEPDRSDARRREIETLASDPPFDRSG